MLWIVVMLITSFQPAGIRERIVGAESLMFLEQVMRDLKPSLDVSGGGEMILHLLR
jgi:hypothetical protein